MKKKKFIYGLITVIIVAICASIGFVLNKQSDKKEDANSSVYNGVELKKPVLQLMEDEVFTQPTDDFDYQSYVMCATEADAPGDFTLIGSPYLTWETYDFTKFGTMKDVKYELKFPNGESVKRYLHVQVQSENAINDDDDSDSTIDYSEATALPEEGDISDATADDPNRQYDSYNLKNGYLKGVGTGEYLKDDESFMIADYNHDQKQAFQAAKEYADAGAGRYMILEKAEYDKLTGYRVMFFDIDKYPAENGVIVETYGSNLDEFWNSH